MCVIPNSAVVSKKLPRRPQGWVLAWAALIIGGCRFPSHADQVGIGCDPQGDTPTARIAVELGVLAADSMRGRMTGTADARRAAEYIARLLASAGIKPAGEGGYYQWLPFDMKDGRAWPANFRLLEHLSDLDDLPPERRGRGANVVALIPGSGRPQSGQAILLAAHYDHLGVGIPIDGDSIYNGADDDASGVVVVIEVARALASGAPMKRSIIVLLLTGEEEGMLGTEWYVRHPVMPMDSTAAALELEMVARPDSLVGGVGQLWLTGFDRSSVGPELKKAGLPIHRDPRPQMAFFERSDNYILALEGVPAHTLSSFDLHADYHRPSDEPARANCVHMRAVVEASVRAVRLLANAPRPVWREGGQPQPDGR